MPMISVGVGDIAVSDDGRGEIVTHALGSCLGITIWDPVAKVGGLLHAMLPNSAVDKNKAEKNPFMFVDTGVPQLFKKAYALGADKKRIELKVAGGASLRSSNSQDDLFKIGKRNAMVLKKLLWKNGVLISSEDIGGEVSRTMKLDLSTGKVTLTILGKEREL
ncbi:MAG TPA: chemotaxis protein CheD [Acidobacteria bacterium]|nr:chemotaxis protein CheD [Acidobacteriota bacterium]